MIFILLLMLSTFAVAGSAAFFSVYGLAQVFSGAFTAVIVMGGALEAGKLIAASFLYRYKHITPMWLKAYLIGAVLTLMLITSVGIFGFLTASYQIDSIDLKQQEERIALLEEQHEGYKGRLRGINAQIEAVAPDYITKRMELIRTFEPEKQNILDNMERLDTEILELRSKVLTTQAKIGPIIYVAEVLERDPDDATFWFVLIIIFVFDPLAVSLTLAANIALKERKDKRELKEEAESIEDRLTMMENMDSMSPDLIKEITSLKEQLMDNNNSEELKAIRGSLSAVETQIKRNNLKNELNAALK